MNKIDWSKSHCGTMLTTFEETYRLMPEVKPIIDALIPHLELPIEEYVVDVKVHMLMPGEYPCIPNWHCDFIPRDKELNKLPHLITGEKMYLWVSGEPKTEFKKSPTIIKTDAGFDWVEFTQKDVHRGIKSTIHTWRCFIRIIPKKFIHPTTINIGMLRRHSQVYIENAADFRW
jgi:hypothetical protein